MNKYIMLLISSLIINAGEIFCAHRIVNNKLNFKSWRLYVAYFLMVLLIFLNYIFSNNIYKVFITLIIMFLVSKILFNKSIKKSVVIAVLMELMTIFAELLFAVFISQLMKIDPNILAQTYQGTIFTNSLISLNLCILSILIFPKYIYRFIVSSIKHISANKLLLFLSIVIISSSFLFYLSYYNSNNSFKLIVNFLITTIYFITVVMIIIKENKYNKIYSKYQITITELEEYESIINQYRIINHENKNQLLSIKGMTKNKKINDYINKIIDNKNSNNKRLLDQALLIPTGGLRGLIYAKMVVMKESNIKYTLNIDKQINNKLINKISSNEMIDICQIVGVFLDNAIEAVSNIKNKEIIISIYKDDKINIEITNNYNNEINLNKIDKIGYSTKGANHGYGLVLVSKILKDNKNFSNEREVSKNIFKQKLVIKI